MHFTSLKQDYIWQQTVMIIVSFQVSQSVSTCFSVVPLDILEELVRQYIADTNTG
jgi:hypothetical protein